MLILTLFVVYCADLGIIASYFIAHQDTPVSEIDIPTPISDGEVPATWWGEYEDRSLVVGTFKHGTSR